MNGPVLLVGAGKMGGALLQGWLARSIEAHDIVVIEPNPAAAEETARAGVRVVPDLARVENDFMPRAILFALKPQAMGEAVPPFARFARRGTAFLSIAAGKSLSFFAAALGPEAAVVRAMPNTPAAIGRGMSVLCANERAGEDDRTLCAELLAAVGEVAWVEDEGAMDAVTAVSGSGPAYVFYLIECMADAGVKAGLPRPLARQLARVTVEGAAALSHQSHDDAAQLRKNVTSPGGTTEAALRVLMADDGLQALMARAIAAAADRSRELAD